MGTFTDATMVTAVIAEDTGGGNVYLTVATAGGHYTGFHKVDAVDTVSGTLTSCSTQPAETHTNTPVTGPFPGLTLFVTAGPAGSDSLTGTTTIETPGLPDTITTVNWTLAR